jgi:acetolactate synthase-1/2/3 large subunit
VLSLPEDMLAAVIPSPQQASAVVATRSAPRAADLSTLADLLRSAARPLLVVGGTGWTAESCANLTDFARRNALPLVASFRRQDLIDNRCENHCGHLTLGMDPNLATRVKSADLVVAIGSRLGEISTNGYTLLVPPVPGQRLVHVHPDPNEPGRVYQPTLAVSCTLADFANALTTLTVASSAPRLNWLREAREAYIKFSTPPPQASEFVDLAAVVGWLSEHLSEDAIVTNGAGNYTVWVHRYFRYRRPRTQLAPVSGSMGYGVPAAIAAKLRYPDRQVIAFAGDGCFLMYPQEIVTALQHQANLIILVVNNGIYGTIRLHQERRYPGRVVATDLRNPDFVALAQSCGAYAARVEATDGFPEAFQRASRAGRPALLELRVDPQQLTPSFRLMAT